MKWNLQKGRLFETTPAMEFLWMSFFAAKLMCGVHIDADDCQIRRDRALCAVLGEPGGRDTPLSDLIQRGGVHYVTLLPLRSRAYQ